MVNKGEGRSGQQPRHLVHVFPSFARGGSQTRFGQLAAAHGGRYRHTVLALDGNLEMAGHIPPSVALECPVPSFDKSAGLLNLALFRRTLKELKPDLLITYNWGAMEWCLANRWRPLAPHIHIEDGFGPEEKQRQLLRRVMFRRLALSGPHTRVVLPSRQLENIALHEWRLPARSVLYVPNGVDCARFAGAASARQEHTTITIGTVATLRTEKNLGRLIRAFAAVATERPADTLKLVIVGDGPERKALETQAQATGMGARILFAGPTATPENALAEMDIFALSSDTEQMPLSVLEAMAAELPVASPAVGDVADMVADENRPYVTPPGDEAGFRRTLGLLADDPSLRKRLGIANRVAALSRFDHNRMIARYADIFG